MFLIVLVGLAISENIEDNVNKKQFAITVNKRNVIVIMTVITCMDKRMYVYSVYRNLRCRETSRPINIR